MQIFFVRYRIEPCSKNRNSDYAHAQSDRRLSISTGSCDVEHSFSMMRIVQQSLILNSTLQMEMLLSLEARRS